MSIKPGKDFKVPPPSVTSDAVGTGGRSSFRCARAIGDATRRDARSRATSERGWTGRERARGDRFEDASKAATTRRGDAKARRRGNRVESRCTTLVRVVADGRRRAKRLTNGIFDDEQRDHVHGFRLDGFFGTIRRPSRRQERVAHDSTHAMLGE
jgi:hypothetical protein